MGDHLYFIPGGGITPYTALTGTWWGPARVRFSKGFVLKVVSISSILSQTARISSHDLMYTLIYRNLVGLLQAEFLPVCQCTAY